MSATAVAITNHRDTARPRPQPKHETATALAALCLQRRCDTRDTNALLCRKNKLQRVSVTEAQRRIDILCVSETLWFVFCLRTLETRSPQ
jgi:hypothetical protein